MSTIVSILLTIGYILWRTYEDRLAKAWRKKADTAMAEQAETIKGMQDALAQCPFVTYPTPYDNDNQRTA